MDDSGGDGVVGGGGEGFGHGVAGEVGCSFGDYDVEGSVFGGGGFKEL